MSSPRKQEAVQLFAHLQAQFPGLRMVVDEADPNVDISVQIPAQPELAFEVNLNLQNTDELHLAAADGFWCSWFPSSDPAVRERYREAVSGLLSGGNRIVEYWRFGRPVRADLQAPSAQGWRTIARSRRGLFPVSWGAEKRVLRNRGAVEQGDEADEP